jgi:uncharacterized protein YegP (UPF0339 family)
LLYIGVKEARLLKEENKMADFQIYKDKSGEYRWRLRADNYEVVADSAEGYVNKHDCEHGIALVKELAPKAEIDDQT